MRPLWGLARQKPWRCAPGRLACHVAVADRAGGTQLDQPLSPRCPASPRCWWASTPWELDLGSVLGAVHGSILNGPQGTQRGLLRLGQAPDARDIDALVVPVTPQRLQQLAALEIPDVHDTIIPATGAPAAIRAALERPDRPPMRLSHSHALSLLQFTPAQHAIAAATQQHHAGRALRHRIHERA